MIELKDWISKANFPPKPWLVLGKGPTFSLRNQLDLKSFNTFALNHVVREEKVTVAHIIDIDVIEACAKTLLTNCDWLIVPRIPHVKCQRSEYLNLRDWLQCVPILAQAKEQGKLVTYSLGHYADQNDRFQIAARYFSSEAALGILGRMGVKEVSLLGIDGGSDYSQSFADLSTNTLLINGQPDFDLQFERLDRIAQEFNLKYTRILSDGDQVRVKQMQAKNPSMLGDDLEPPADPAITLPEVRSLDIGQTCQLNNSKPEFPTLPRAEKYAASYIYRRKIFPRSIAADEQKQTLSEKVQSLESDLRAYREKLEDALDELAKVSKDLVISSQRLNYCRSEIEEYKDRVLHLEQNLHGLVRSATWKLGRTLTKPVDAIGRGLSKRTKDDSAS
jgi:hypothetical protein